MSLLYSLFLSLLYKLFKGKGEEATGKTATPLRRVLLLSLLSFTFRHVESTTLLFFYSVISEPFSLGTEEVEPRVYEREKKSNKASQALLF